MSGMASSTRDGLGVWDWVPVVVAFGCCSAKGAKSHDGGSLSRGRPV